MNTRKTWSAIALAIISMNFCIFYGECALEAVEAASVRGNHSFGDGIWRADDFGWFYYDLDKDTGGEELLIRDVWGRTAERGDVVYSSKRWSKDYEFASWGSYDVAALFGRLFFAGYRDSTFTEEVSSLDKGDLRLILRDEDAEHILSKNINYPLEQGYSITVAGTSEKDKFANLILFKNEERIHESTVDVGDTFIHEVEDFPVIVIHLANVIGEDGFAVVDGTFQISDSPIAKLVKGGILGNMELDEISEDGIEFRNTIDLNLERNTQVYLTPNLLLFILDLPDLVYYPLGIITDYGIHEIRGPAFNGGSRIPVKLGSNDSTVLARWNAMNYSGFYCDPEDMLGNETLVLFSVQGRRVSPPSHSYANDENDSAYQKGFQYTTFLQPKEFDFKPWGSYCVINFMGAQWFAGYDSSVSGTKAKKSLLEHEYLGKVLWDAELQGIIFAGNYTIPEGYEIRFVDVDNDSIFLQLLKNGTPVDSSVIKSNSTYIYKKDLGNIDDLPIIMMHLDRVFSNESFIIDALFQISENIISIEEGNAVGKLQIVWIDPGYIIMVNNEYIDLNRNSTVYIAPMMSIRVADNDTLRYYLYTDQYVVPLPGAPITNIPDNISSGTPANFSIFEQAAEINQVTVDIVDSSNRTVFSRDITELGRGSGEFWMFNWIWNATVLQLSDEGGRIMDVGENLVPTLLRLNESSPEELVGVYFNSTGKIGRILNRNSIYYASRSEYQKLKVTSDYDTMLANDTLRRQFIKIEPGNSTLCFQDIVDGRLNPSGQNHTLHGTIDSLEPHVIAVGAPPGRYELRLRIENAVDAIQVKGEYFNVTAAPICEIFPGPAEATDQ